MNINSLFRNSSKNLLLLTAILCVGFLTSCKDEDPGAPEVYNVRLTDPETAGLDLEKVTLGAYLVVQGKNLATTTDVYFNNMEAYVYGTFITDGNLIIQVPDTTPTIATDPLRATNELRIITKYGEVTHTLTILPPPPIIDSISNEFAFPGEKITVYGKYFFFVNSVQFPDSVVITDGITAAENGSSCSFTVPDGIGSGYLKVTSESGTSSERYSAIFYDTASLFCEFEDPEFDVDGNAKIYNTSSYPLLSSIKDNYVFFPGTNIAAGSYFTQTLALETQYVNYQEAFTYPDSTQIADDFSASKLALEFEIYVKDDWTSGFFEIAFLPQASWTQAYRYYFFASRVDPSEFGQWVTKRIRISEFIGMDEAGANFNENPLAYSQIKNTPFNMNFKNPSAEAGGITIPKLSLAMDNFRIVKISD